MREIKLMATGLRDKNGREIYEGDVISTGDIWPTERGGIVRFGRGTFDLGAYVFQGFYLDRGDEERSDGSAWYMLQTEHIEVVGNIHENPELASTTASIDDSISSEK